MAAASGSNGNVAAAATASTGSSDDGATPTSATTTASSIKTTNSSNLRPKGKLSINILSGRRIISSHSSGRLNPYLKLSFGSQAKRTRVARDATAEPQWKEKITFEVSMSSSHVDRPRHHQLLVEIYDQDRTSTHQMGQARIPLNKLYEDEEMDGWFKLYGSVDNADAADIVGDIYLEFTYTPPGGRRRNRRPLGGFDESILPVDASQAASSRARGSSSPPSATLTTFAGTTTSAAATTATTSISNIVATVNSAPGSIQTSAGQQHQLRQSPQIAAAVPLTRQYIPAVQPSLSANERGSPVVASASIDPYYGGMTMGLVPPLSIAQSLQQQQPQQQYALHNQYVYQGGVRSSSANEATSYAINSGGVGGAGSYGSNIDLGALATVGGNVGGFVLPELQHPVSATTAVSARSTIVPLAVEDVTTPPIPMPIPRSLAAQAPSSAALIASSFSQQQQQQQIMMESPVLVQANVVYDQYAQPPVTTTSIATDANRNRAISSASFINAYYQPQSPPPPPPPPPPLQMQQQDQQPVSSGVYNPTLGFNIPPAAYQQPAQIVYMQPAPQLQQVQQPLFQQLPQQQQQQQYIYYVPGSIPVSQ